MMRKTDLPTTLAQELFMSCIPKVLFGHSSRDRTRSILSYMHKKTNARPVRNFVLVISLLHIIIGVTSINLSAFSLLGNCQYSAQAAGVWGSLANLLCASFGLTLSFETKRKVVLVYIFVSACTVLTSAFQLSIETAALVVERQFCAKNSFFGHENCKVDCINTHMYIMVTAVASLFVSLFSSLVLSHGIQRLSTG